MKNIVVLISGNGSNLQAIMDSCANGTIKNARVAAVIANKADAYGLTRAQQANIDAITLLASDFADRQAYEQALAKTIDGYHPDVVVLAGFMRILDSAFVHHYQGRIFNIHPSLLPKYPGLNTHQRALEAGDSEHGTTVHFVTPELDGGPVVLQAKVPIFPQDSIAEIEQRVQQQEYAIYPLVINWFLSQRLVMDEAGKALLDGHNLPLNGYASDD
ncbi:phosphoribosylglycinamide formyltransferase [Photobacterium damselae subsp. damselae]|uniref:phosphoribosylglycinamide formyltransferase n=1 Tax=Photobacterium damselae TaxID=38293 RepID=UPI00311ACB84